jgi:hypothetical protein
MRGMALAASVDDSTRARSAADFGGNAMPELSEKRRDKLPDSDFAFPKERKEPIHDAEHLRNAIARFDQVEGVSNKERDDAWNRIKRAAKKFDVELDEDDWRDVFRRNGKRVPSD